MTVYVVGQYKGETQDGIIWELQGVYDSPDSARKACIGRDWFMGPAMLNEPFPAEKTKWEGCEYPNGAFENEADYLAWKQQSC